MTTDLVESSRVVVVVCIDMTLHYITCLTLLFFVFVVVY